jgi:hypothetical protein
MHQTAMFVFNGAPTCFVHVMLNALDMHGRGEGVQIVMEGGSTKLVGKLGRPEHKLHGLWEKVKGLGLVAGTCRACSQQLGVQADSVAQKLPLLDDMHGHPGLARFRDAGYQVLIF